MAVHEPRWINTKPHSSPKATPVPRGTSLQQSVHCQQGLVQPQTLTSLISLSIMSRQTINSWQKLWFHIQPSRSRNPTVGKVSKAAEAGFFPPSHVQKWWISYQCKHSWYKASHSPLVMSVIWLPSPSISMSEDFWQKFGETKHLHIMTAMWNNMNIYTHWHGTTTLPI